MNYHLFVKLKKQLHKNKSIPKRRTRICLFRTNQKRLREILYVVESEMTNCRRRRKKGAKGKEKSRVRESYGTPFVGGGDGCYTWNCSLASPACRKIASRSVLGTRSGAGNSGKCQVVTFMRSTTCHGIGKCVVINGVPIQSHPE